MVLREDSHKPRNLMVGYPCEYDGQRGIIINASLNGPRAAVNIRLSTGRVITVSRRELRKLTVFEPKKSELDAR